MIVGDLYCSFEHLNHQILAALITQKIDDQQFLDLYWKAVKVGYIDLASGKKEYGLTGIPLGGVLSPILSNIFLHELDSFVNVIIEKEKAKDIPISIENPKYKKVHTMISNRYQSLRKLKDRKPENIQTLLREIKSLSKERANFPSKYTNYATLKL